MAEPYATVATCNECDGVHLQFHDEDDVLIFAISLAPESAVKLGQQCLAEGENMLRCAGVAN